MGISFISPSVVRKFGDCYDSKVAWQYCSGRGGVGKDGDRDGGGVGRGGGGGWAYPYTKKAFAVFDVSYFERFTFSVQALLKYLSERGVSVSAALETKHSQAWIVICMIFTVTG